MIGVGFIIRTLGVVLTVVIVGALLILTFTVVIRVIMFTLDKLGVETGNLREWISEKIRRLADSFDSKKKEE